MLRMNLLFPRIAFLKEARPVDDKVGERVMCRQREGFPFHSLMTRLCRQLLVMDKLRRAEWGRSCRRWQNTRLGRCSRHMGLPWPLLSSVVSIHSLTTFSDSTVSSMEASDFLLVVGVQQLMEVLIVG